MNTYTASALNQIEIALKTIIEMIETLKEADLQQRPASNKRSIGELLEHIAVICRADLLISNGATQKEMAEYYSSVSLKSVKDVKDAIAYNYEILKDSYRNITESELQERTTSYWGATYTRYEWLLEIVAHIYHHRAQLHTLLVYCYGKDLNILLFE
ncbi:DinB family protein [Cytobacillus oceanisediminis]|uniref:DinB family protein n=1 Tax=Niallia alba TaxID=2729105 RepID=A0A7Y0PMP4_9BACI|nr:MULTISPECIES: DinB family protein [Bacillaceae]MBZ9536981.1 DinB family protein [Cytobacillus oceanisediminis]NMO77551.1 DinB family protein [Niallia alba]